MKKLSAGLLCVAVFLALFSEQLYAAQAKLKIGKPFPEATLGARGKKLAAGRTYDIPTGKEVEIVFPRRPGTSLNFAVLPWTEKVSLVQMRKGKDVNIKVDVDGKTYYDFDLIEKELARKSAALEFAAQIMAVIPIL